MSDELSEEDVWNLWEDTAVTLRTRATTRQVLFVLVHMAIVGDETVVEIRKLLNELVSKPKKGVKFILRFDSVLKSRFQLYESLITETFISEINDAIDLYKPEKEEPSLNLSAQIRDDYSRLYGKNSAWN